MDELILEFCGFSCYCLFKGKLLKYGSLQIHLISFHPTVRPSSGSSKLLDNNNPYPTLLIPLITYINVECCLVQKSFCLLAMISV